MFLGKGMGAYFSQGFENTRPWQVFCTLGKYWCKQLQRAGRAEDSTGKGVEY